MTIFKEYNQSLKHKWIPAKYPHSQRLQMNVEQIIDFLVMGQLNLVTEEFFLTTKSTKRPEKIAWKRR